MVAEDEAKASNFGPSTGGLTSSDCSKASAGSASPSQVILYSCEQLENESVFPLKKRKSLLISFNQEEDENKKQDNALGITFNQEEDENKKQDNALGISFNQEEDESKKQYNALGDQVNIQENIEGDTDIHHHDPVGAEEVSNPIELVAIAATWLTTDEAARKRQRPFTRPRSRTTMRRPRTDYTCLTDDKAFADKIAIPELQVHEGHENESDDLYSKVKMRRGKNADKGAETRCSRVNGKGWRCSQRTRVGYLLCEHHLGRQERLRRIGNQLGNSIGPKKKRGRKKKDAGADAGADTGDTNKTKSIKNIMETTEPISKW